MRGTIVPRGQSYRIVISLGRDSVSGKYKRYTETAPSRGKAEKRLTAILHELDKGTFHTPERIRLSDYLTKWLNNHKGNISPRVYESYESLIRVHIIPKLGNNLLPQLRGDQLEKYYADLLDSGLSKQTIKHHHALLHKALADAKLGRNVADTVKPYKVDKPEMLFWDIDDVEGFLSSIKDTEYYPMFFTLLHTGMRRSEVLALRWKDIDLIFGQISISRGLHQLTDRSIIFKPPKSKMSRRTIAMTPANIKVITGYHLHREEQHKLLGMDKITDNDMVFSHIDGKPMLPNSVSHAWARLSSEYGNPIRLHDARHTHASILLQLGVHPKVVQERLGHANIGITLDIYSHIRPGMQEDAAKLFDKALAKTQE